MEDFSVSQAVAWLMNTQFWSIVGVGLVAWYILSCVLARALFNNGREADEAVSKATLIAALLTACVAALGVWIYLQSILATLLVLVLLLLLPLLLVWLINRVEAARQGM